MVFASGSQFEDLWILGYLQFSKIAVIYKIWLAHDIISPLLGMHVLFKEFYKFADFKSYN